MSAEQSVDWTGPLDCFDDDERPPTFCDHSSIFGYRMLAILLCVRRTSRLYGRYGLQL